MVSLAFIISLQEFKKNLAFLETAETKYCVFEKHALINYYYLLRLFVIVFSRLINFSAKNIILQFTVCRKPLGNMQGCRKNLQEMFKL